MAPFPDLNDPVVKEIVAARVNLLFHKPFFGNLAARLQIVDASSWCKTAATDGKHLYYNRDFIKKLTKQQLIFLIAHEILHCVYDHLGRRGSRKPELWNMANDYVVNYTLKKEGVGQMPEVGLYSDQYTDEMTSEEVYKLLEQNQVKVQMTLDEHLDLGDDGDDGGEGDGSGRGEGEGDDDGDGKDGKSGEGNDGKGKGNKKVTATVSGKDGPPKLSKDELQKIRNEMRAAVIQAAQTVGAGKVPAGIKRLIADITEPKLDWRTLIEMHIQSAMKDDYTFLKPSRRSWATGCILPGQNVLDTIDVMVWIDASGSISDEMLKDFLSEVKGIMDQFPDFVLHLATFDTKAYNYIKFTPDNMDEIMEYEIGGGGGTDFLAMYNFMEENDITPEKMVVFTDGYPCGSWGNEEYCPDVLWIIHYDANIVPPFGTHVLYETNGRKYR
ncbi:MAG: hypothetical protein HC836_33180 [Richelia sp. RM2_1_2]|nr:hypothetical protein [Richelia sp. RM2_1_2]